MHRDITEEDIERVIDSTFDFGFGIDPPGSEVPPHMQSNVGEFADYEIHKMATQAAWEAPIIAAVANAVEPGTGALVMTAAENLAKADRRANALKFLGPQNPYLPLYMNY